MEKLNELSKQELINKLISYVGICKRQQNSLMHKTAIIRHFKIRLKKIRNSIDYLIEHPFSVDSTVGGRKHQRDMKGMKDYRGRN